MCQGDTLQGHQAKPARATTPSLILDGDLAEDLQPLQSGAAPAPGESEAGAGPGGQPAPLLASMAPACHCKCGAALPPALAGHHSPRRTACLARDLWGRGEVQLQMAKSQGCTSSGLTLSSHILQQKWGRGGVVGRFSVNWTFSLPILVCTSSALLSLSLHAPRHARSAFWLPRFLLPPRSHPIFLGNSTSLGGIPTQTIQAQSTLTARSRQQRAACGSASRTPAPSSLWQNFTTFNPSRAAASIPPCGFPEPLPNSGFHSSSSPALHGRGSPSPGQ